MLNLSPHLFLRHPSILKKKLNYCLLSIPALDQYWSTYIITHTHSPTSSYPTSNSCKSSYVYVYLYVYMYVVCLPHICHFLATFVVKCQIHCISHDNGLFENGSTFYKCVPKFCLQILPTSNSIGNSVNWKFLLATLINFPLSWVIILLYFFHVCVCIWEW